MGPFSDADGFDCFGARDEISPSLASGVDDGVVVFEDVVGEPVRPQILPDVFHRVEFGSARGKQDRGDVGGYGEVGRRVPTGTVEDQDGMRACSDVTGYLVEVKLDGSINAPLNVDLAREAGALGGGGGFRDGFERG